MGNQWGLGLHFTFVTIFLVATTNTCLGARNTTVACSEHERLALLKFKHGVIDDYDMLSSWVGDNCCMWERVMCDGVTANVESLYLRGDFDPLDLPVHRKHLVGTELGTSLKELRHLKYLDLSGNDFQGSRIPKFIGSLRQLTYLNLSNANFSGIIPHQIGNLSSLMNLGLRSYEMTWKSGLSSYDMSWISGLSSLRHLDLSYANLSGAKNLDMVLYMIPSIKVLRLAGCSLLIDDLDPLPNSSTSLSKIRHLDLSYNTLKGQPPNFFHNMTTLQILDLSSVPLSLASNFANSLSMIPSLLELHLSSCYLKQTRLSHILHNTSTLSNIQHLDLSNNRLTSSIPGSLRKLELLHVLDLSYNMLTGPIPTFLGKLSELHLSSNHLNGSIPEFCGRLCDLKTLSLGNNQLSGSIPVSIGQLSKLRTLEVYYNSLEGVVSESHFSNLSMLKVLNIAYNSRLTFNVSHDWLPPFQLRLVDLHSCKIANGFPQWLRNQKTLDALDLSNATISGPLPTWLRKMPIIPYIDLSHNNLSGPLTNLPSRGTNTVDVGQLYLQNNIFNESIRSLCMRTDLVYLDLSSNMLTGKIPKCLKNLQELYFMRLSSNKLYGVVPSFIGNLSSLASLNLDDNNFKGELPVEFWNLSQLMVLDLGNNAFQGKIPESIGEKIQLMRVFRLHNNNFTGEIPRSLCRNVGLQILDVAHNDFTGTIPRCLGKLQGMVSHYHFNDLTSDILEETVTQVMKGIDLEYTKTWFFVTNMDLSSNKLVGDIPVELTALWGLVGLNLSNNHLSGGIPHNIGNMTTLISLDLSGNELVGEVPPSITALTFLSHLNLSNNNLSGRIPTGNQLQTLIDPSIYAGNKGLCGSPLPKNCSNHEDPTAIAKTKYEAAAHEHKKAWFYVDITCGFATGFWGVIIVLLLKKQWRHKLFLFAEAAMDKIHVSIMVRVNKMKRGREAI